jgi:hypothetical protein
MLFKLTLIGINRRTMMLTSLEKPEDMIQEKFKVFYHQAFESKPTPDEAQQAETRFRNGVTLTRQARDRAIALLPPKIAD